MSNMLSTVLIVFIILKITGLVEWSWIFVLSPLWIPVALGVFFLVVALILEEASKV